MKKSLFDRFYKQEMDKASLDDVGEQTGSELTSPPPPKQPRTDYTVTDDHRGKSKSDFPVLTFPISPPSALSTPQESEELVCATKRGGFPDENSHGQPQDAKLNVTPFTEAAAPHCGTAHAGSPDQGFITAERHSPAVSEDERLPVTEIDEPDFFPGDNTGGRSAPAGTDAPPHLTGNQPRESFEEETPGDCSLSAGNERDEGQVRSRAISGGAQSEEVTRRPDCTQKGNHTNVSSEDSGADQKRDELETSDNSLSEEEGKSPKPLRDHDYTKLCPNPEEETQGKSPQAERRIQTEFQIPERECVSTCNLETKGQVNETDWRESVFLSAAECAEESILACDVVSDGNTATESVRFEVDDFCGANGASAAGKIIAEATSEKADHATETTMPAGISQERAGGDNDAGPFGVIDPAIWSETDREADEKRWNSESAASGGLSPSVNMREMEAPRSDVRLPSPDRSGRFNHQSATRQGEDEDSCQARSIVANKPHDTASGENPPGSPPASPAGDDGKLESHNTARHELKEQSATSRLPGGLNHQQVEISHSEDDETAEIKERVESFVTATKSDEHQSSESETREADVKFKLIEEEQGNQLKCLSGLSLTMEVTSEGKGGKDDMETDGHGDSETLENSDVKQEDEHTTQAAQWSSGESTGRKKVALCNENDQERDCRLTGDIKKNLLAFTSSPGSDSLVPCQRDFSRSQNAHHSSPAPSRNRFSPPTSAFTLHSHVLGGFDTFQKIQLSQSDDDDDDDNIVGLDNSARVPVLRSSTHQMLGTPHEAELHEGVEREDAGSVRGASSRDELPNFTSAADVIAVEPPGCELADGSSDPRQRSDSSPSSEVNVCPQFDMKPQFDMVLKELQLFFDISRSEFAEHCGDASKPLEGNASERGDPSSPEVEQHRDTTSDDVDDDRSLEIRGGRPTVRSDGEQEVPLGSHLCQETLEDAEGPRRERLETQQERRTWSPSFGFEPLSEQLSHRLLEPPRRLEPLKTCTGPRRVGLSKKARIKPLHCPRPYQ